jgi:formylglycine-generating enzyme required for sulfatase activity
MSTWIVGLMLGVPLLACSDLLGLDFSPDQLADDAGAFGSQCAPGGRGLNTCGPSKNESCCISLEVEGGTFFRTYDESPQGDFTFVVPDGGPTGEADPATVSTLRLDKYDVTVGRFRQFVKAWNGAAGWAADPNSGKHTHLNGGQGLVDIGALADAGTGFETGWDPRDTPSVAPTNANLACDSYATWTAEPGNNEDRPINCVRWEEAYAFCIWDGGFLPTEAEWEYAAAGGSQQRAFPWGETDPGTANQYAIYGCYYPPGSAGFTSCRNASNIAPVGTTAPHGAGRFGQLDLAGNMYQWTLDWFAPYVGCVDCAYLTPTDTRVIRGGSFYLGERYLFCPYRNPYPVAVDRDHAIGFRCARAP